MQNRTGSAVTWSHVCLYSFSGVIVLLEKAARKLLSVESFLPKPLSVLTKHIWQLLRHVDVGSASSGLFYYEFSFVTAHYYYNAAMVSSLHLSAFFMKGEQGACSVLSHSCFISETEPEKEGTSQQINIEMDSVV